MTSIMVKRSTQTHEHLSFKFQVGGDGSSANMKEEGKQEKETNQKLTLKVNLIMLTILVVIKKMN